MVGFFIGVAVLFTLSVVGAALLVRYEQKQKRNENGINT